MSASPHPLDLTPFGQELAIKWSDGLESFIPLETLRKACPCASCAGEGDLLGMTKPEVNLTAESYVLVRLQMVGGYSVQPHWKDGHSTGLFSWKYLRSLCEKIDGG